MLNVTGATTMLFVFDMPASVAFYRDVLGFEVISTSNADGGGADYYWCLLRLGGASLMLNTRYDGDARPPEPEPIGHDMTIYFSCESVDAAYAELRTKWPKTEPPETAPYGMRQMYMTDPDGFQLCFQHPV